MTAHPFVSTPNNGPCSSCGKSLRDTRAKYIFPFGRTTEISGSFIAHLNGYQLYGPHDSWRFVSAECSETDFWCFARNDVAQPKESETLKYYRRQTIAQPDGSYPGQTE